MEVAVAVVVEAVAVEIEGVELVKLNSLGNLSSDSLPGFPLPLSAPLRLSELLGVCSFSASLVAD